MQGAKLEARMAEGFLGGADGAVVSFPPCFSLGSAVSFHVGCDGTVLQPPSPRFSRILDDDDPSWHVYIAIFL